MVSDSQKNRPIFSLHMLEYYKVKLSGYMPWRRLGGEKVWLLLILNLGTRSWWVVSIIPRPRFTPWDWTRRYPLYRAGWAPELVWTQRIEEKSSASVGDRTPVVQSVVTHYTDWATAAPVRTLYNNKNKNSITFYDSYYHIVNNCKAVLKC
jgi:hypothetical protein